MLTLPLLVDTPLYEYRLTLSGREFVLRVDYNGREDRWYLALSDKDGTPISGRRKIVCGKPLLRHCHHLPSCPPGEIFAADKRGTVESPGAAPGLQDLGRRVTLYYGELVELGVA
jgi:hypothetical protein